MIRDLISFLKNSSISIHTKEGDALGDALDAQCIYILISIRKTDTVVLDVAVALYTHETNRQCSAYFITYICLKHK